MSFTELLRDDFEVPVLSAELQEKAEKEVHEKQDWRVRDIDGLRQLILEEDKDTLNAPKSSQFLLKFLRAKKFDYDRAHKLVLQYYRVRYKYPEIFKDLTPKKVKDFDQNIVFMLPTVDENGCRVFCVDLRLEALSDFCQWDNKRDIEPLLCMAILVLETELMKDYTQIYGLTLLLDVRGRSLTQLIQLSRSCSISRVSDCFQNSFPLRIKSLHVMSESGGLDLIMSLSKAFMSQKMKSRLFIHHGKDQEYESLRMPSFVSKDSYKPDDETMGALSANEEYFDQLSKYGFTVDPVNGGGVGGNGGSDTPRSARDSIRNFLLKSSTLYNPLFCTTPPTD